MKSEDPVVCIPGLPQLPHLLRAALIVNCNACAIQVEIHYRLHLCVSEKEYRLAFLAIFRNGNIQSTDKRKRL